MTTHSFAGTNPERARVGDPGHCERCAEVGHVTAHPDLGCGDVGCTQGHGPEDEPDTGGPRTPAETRALVRAGFDRDDLDESYPEFGQNALTLAFRAGFRLALGGEPR